VGVITIFIQKLLTGEELPIFGEGTQVRDFVNVDDVAEANLLAMDYDGPSQVFNIGTGVGTTINSLAQVLKKMTNKSSQLKYLKIQPGEPSSSVADITMARNQLGFSPHWSLEEKLPEVIEWNIRKKATLS
jgi:UDP-glucose 4-epimerase